MMNYSLGLGVRNVKSRRSATRLNIAQHDEFSIAHAEDVPAPVHSFFEVQVQLRSVPVRPGLQGVGIAGRSDHRLVVQGIRLFFRADLYGDLICRLRDDNHLWRLSKNFADARTIGVVRISTSAKSTTGRRRVAVSGIDGWSDLAEFPASREVWHCLGARDYRQG